MKKYLMTLAAVLCCTMTTVFTACGDDEESYPESYRYEITIDKESSGYTEEIQEVTNAFYNAIGTDGRYYQYYQTKQDDLMKAACEAVRKQYANRIQSPYFKFYLYRITSSAAPGHVDASEVIATYEMGQALTYPYYTYAIESNSENAFEALKAKEDQLDPKVYQASYKTLVRLLGRHTSQSISGGTVSSTSYSQYEKLFREAFQKVYPESESNDLFIIGKCDSIANAHAADTLAVDATVIITKTGYLNKRVNKLWEKTFRANF